MAVLRANLLSGFSWLAIAMSCVPPPTTPAYPLDVAFTLVEDTLRGPENLKIYPDQKLVPGNGAGANGWYKTIYFKNLANWALLLNRKLEIENNPDYQLDESRRDKDKLKELLVTRDTLVIAKIEKRGNKKYGERYVVSLKQGQGLLALKYECYIADALQSEEIKLVQQ